MPEPPKTPPALAIPLWVIAVALLLIAGAIAFQGYVEITRRDANPSATAPTEVPSAGIRRPNGVKSPRLVFTNSHAARPTPPTPPAGSLPTTSRASLVPDGAVFPTGTNVSGVVSPTNSLAAEPPGVGQLKILPLPYSGIRDPRITGRVLFVGAPPLETPLAMDPACGQLRGGQIPTTRFYVRGTNGGLANVLVYLSKGLEGMKYELPNSGGVITETGCEFSPLIAAVRVGFKCVIRNSDPVLHYPHIAPGGGARDFYLSQPPKGADLEFVLLQPEFFVRVKCEVHSWMSAYLSALDHPFYFVSDADGGFRMPVPPPGRYEITAHHLKAGTKTQVIEVEARKGLEVEFRFGGGRQVGL